MTTVQEIIAAIDKLSLEQRAEIARHLHGWTDDDWDNQIKKDYDDGKLDALLKAVDDDIAHGRVEEGP